MVTTRSATLVHTHGSRFTTTTGTGRSITWGDDATAGELSPVETIIVALAACSAMDVISIALKKRQGIDRYAIHVKGEQRDEYPQVLTRIDVTHEVVGPRVDEEAIRRCIELSATKYCPVNAMLSAGATEVHHRYVLRNNGPAPFSAEGEVVTTGPYRRPDIVE
ncbi:MAG TPA: OsmC family protein [Candidatus Limnocylindrales bacterium]|nr:OsmC family protein [Candidatus Limnocylindrales bacterium]